MSGRILIADDVATNRIIMKVKLSAASYEVIQAETAAKVLETASRNPPDLFILDVVMADKSGLDLCRTLRSNPVTRSVPIIMVSVRNDTETRLAALAAGADEFLSKPIDEMILLARVRNLLRARVVGEELERRQGTALELGFAEGAPAFARPGRIALVGARPDVAVGWRNAIEDQFNSPIEVLPKEQVLDSIGRGISTPDVIVVSADFGQAGGGLTLLAELRSRNRTRHAAIIVVHDQSDQRSGVTALDMGANDLLTTDCDPKEMVLRIRAQLSRKMQADRLRETVEDGLKLAMIDPLTGLFNRRYALPHLNRIAARATQNNRPFAVMVLDLDHFKRINDTFGHSAGDAVLVEISNRVKNNLRGVDLVARIGGEEFLVVMPDTDWAEARAAAERLRRVTAETPVRLAAGAGEVPVTLSIGVSIGGMANYDTALVQTLVDRADRALMGAKTHGRNQVTFGKSAA